MKDGLIISGFGGVGKTYLAKKYKNVIDLESSPFKYDYSTTEITNYEKLKGQPNRKLNPDYPNNYIEAIKKAVKEYDIVCVRYNGDEKEDFYDSFNIKYIVCLPTPDAYKTYVQRFRERGNSEDWIKKNKGFYKIALKRAETFKGEIIWLDRGETLESALIKRGIKLS